MKRYQKILVRQNRAGYKAKQGRAQGKTGRRAQGKTGRRAQGKTGPGARQNRAGRKAKQGRAQGETGPDADTGITGKDPLRRKAAQNAAESLFPYLRVTFPCIAQYRA